ncbi:DUF3043 domain-containing protein [Ornithinimicrobium pekingense]|uniref:DUF3043 domain-containing protein n=1 Tax=Ornithinimicrobium pekingense TaxID=384677 RepID=A0ABQ2F7K1_9MICO|nr:DUF3043 domain-containing protein [Ornithinimicrobium pekingense]GGK69187.1 hypothetical protein GCM10011509_16990 [Ornithinimicrobium pekingense]
MRFGKKSEPVELTASQSTTVEEAAVTDRSRPQGKGRPTPRRREAEAANRRPLVQSTKGRSPEDKAKIRAERAKARDGMMRGEQKYLMERDRGPERRFLRDAVDRRWNVGEILLPAMVVILALSFLPYDWARQLFVGAYALILFGILDGWLLWKRTKARFIETFGTEPGRGSAWYVVLRSFQMRASRVPRPAVARGEELRRH